MSEIILRADTPAELRVGLAELDIDVPPRSEGRRNHHAERYCIAQVLATLPFARFSFPLTLTHSDKPDFLLAMPGTDVGIEHTEAVPENIARADFLRQREGLGPDVYFTPHALAFRYLLRSGRPRPRNVAGRAVVRVAHRATCGVSPHSGFHRSLAPLG